MAYISRDPFARAELHRDTVAVAHNHTCTECGNVRISRTGRRTLYQYRVEQDDGRHADIAGLFCSVGCMRVYHMG